MKYRRAYIVAGAVVLAVLCAVAFTVSLGAHSAAQRSAAIVAGYEACVNSSNEKVEIGMCLRHFAKTVMADDSVADVDTALGTLSDEADLIWCHEFMHYAGWELYDKKGNFAEAFAAASGRCDSGMMHGVVEEYVSKSAPGNDVAHFAKLIAPETCEDSSAPEAKATCYHGLGHAFMFLTDNALNTSLTYCDYLAQKLRPACYGGVYMEESQEKQVGRTNVGHKSLFTSNPGDPDYPCDTLDTAHKSVCYRFVGSANFLKSPNDIKSAFTRCLAVDAIYRTDCYWGIGNNLPSPSTDTRTAAAECDGALKVGTEAYRQCIMGGVTFVVQMDRGKADQAVIYCDAVQAPYRNVCWSTAGSNLKNWTSSQEEFTNVCAAFPSDEARALCTGT